MTGALKHQCGSNHEPNGNTDQTTLASTLSVPETARHLGIHPKTAYTLIRNGDFPVPVLTIGRTRRVSRIMLERYLSTGSAA